MADDDDLIELNREIAVRETAGDRDWFANVLLANPFVMRRAGLVYNDRDQFLDKVAASAERRTEDTVVVFRTDRTAMVACTVHIEREDGSWAAYRNARLFVRNEPDLSWQLFAWANDPAEQ
jgi:hypothetical protein